VLCQHILIHACRGPFDADALFATFTSTGAFCDLTREAFDRCLDMVATGGYALRAYDRWQRLQQRADGKWQLRDPRAATQIRMNLGTIQDTDTLKVRLKGRGGGRPLGEIEEGFAATLTQGDTFLIGGRVVRYEGLRELTVEVTRRANKPPKIATFMGTKFATSTQLSERILNTFSKGDWPDLPKHTADWLALQRRVSKLPSADRLLIESFPHDGRHHTCVYGFAGRNAMQTLGLLVTERMERAGLDPLGFVSTDYAVLIWGLNQVPEPEPLFDRENLKEDFENWLSGNAVMKRTFRASATIAGLLERNWGHQRRTGRQASFSSDILYDTLNKYDPDHLMLDITRDEAMKGLVDFGRIENMLDRTDGRIDHMILNRVTPLAAPLFLEPGRVPVFGEGRERLVEEEAAKLMQAAGLDDLAQTGKPGRRVPVDQG
jgi:ATP-dependent Lhr-like helicase